MLCCWPVEGGEIFTRWVLGKESRLGVSLKHVLNARPSPLPCFPDAVSEILFYYVDELLCHRSQGNRADPGTETFETTSHKKHFLLRGFVVLGLLP